jgi:nicotinamidase-related amidase
MNPNSGQHEEGVMAARPRGIRPALLLSCCLAWCGLDGLAGAGPTPETTGDLHLSLRTRLETFKGSGTWDEVVLCKDWPARETALLVCDMWDKHWCPTATQRCAALAKKMAPVLAAAQARGITVIHAPSECMDFYKDTPQRRRIQEVPRVPPPRNRDLSDPPLPIDDSDGGCDCEPSPKMYRAWTRQHPALPIAASDVISDDGREVYSFLRQRGIKNLLVMGVHTNMCVLGRTFAIRQMTRWGIRCVLVRDLTDSMYNPKKAPFVSHDAGTELVVQHIEKYWCPSVLSRDLLQDLNAGR